MGGSIAFITKADNIVKCYETHTSTISNLVTKVDLYSDSNNNSLKNYLSDYQQYNEIAPSGYGAFIIDYDKRKFHVINDYSYYFDIIGATILSHKKTESGECIYQELFDKKLLYIQNIHISKPNPYEKGIKKKRLELDDIRTFSSLEDLKIWMIGRRDFPFVSTENGNEHIRISDEEYIRNELRIDLKKMNWVVDHHNTEYQYVSLFKTLLNDGWKFNNNDIEGWKEFIDVEEIDEFKKELAILKAKQRDGIIDNILN